ncbi:hypothetical protein Clacol_006743 [Clathrus columnatus]|uniref:Calcineurin-like phosphoesterase domain-containing protein n=1 Tax=Clathrus columnatus TaxID=1419009 RepID=A0AAV5AHZ7_9AGAM|nr:hypothetical protein Clacol_006743 [Clathrus columnatus]
MSFPSSSSRVYTTYDLNNPPGRPGSDWTRFVCISDTHSRIVPVPPGDVLLHAGDLSSHGTLRDLEITLNWLKSLPHPLKMSASMVLDAARDLVTGEDARESGICYLEYESFKFDVNGHTWKVYGSPAVPRYVDGAFQYTTPETAEGNLIPSDIDILLTHTPPHGIHDFSGQGNHAGCPILASRLRAIEHNVRTTGRKSTTATYCRLHVWGHIHEARGASISTTILNRERVQVNAAIRREYPPIIVDLRHEKDA